MANFLQLDNLPGGHGGGSGGGGTGNIGLNTAFTNVTATVNSSGLSINAAGYAGTGTTFTNVTATLNSVGLQFNASGYAGTATTLAAGLSATLNSVGLNLSVGPYITTGRASTDAIGLNTAQTNVTWTVNSSGISLNAGGYAGTGTSVTNASVTLNTAGLAISVAAPSGATISSFVNMPLLNQISVAHGQTRSDAVAFNMPQAGSFSFLRLPASFSTSIITNYTSNVTMTSGGNFVYHTFNAVAYSVGTGANSTVLTSVASGSAGMTLGNSYSFNVVNSGWSVTQSIQADAYGSSVTVGSSTQYSQTSASLNWSSGLWTNFSGQRFADIRFANSLSAGAYWLIPGVSTSTTTSGQVNANATGNLLAWANFYGNSQANSWWNAVGDTAGSSGGLLNCGVLGNAGTTASLALSALSSSASNIMLCFQMLRSA